MAVSFVKECGAMLQDLSPQGLHGIFERFRGILHEGEIDKRVQFTIEGLFAVRKAKFEGHPPVIPELDLVEQEDQITHEVSLEDNIDPETALGMLPPCPGQMCPLPPCSCSCPCPGCLLRLALAQPRLVVLIPSCS